MVDPASGVIKVPRAFVVADAGQIINPDGLINQIEGGIIQSTSWTLHEQVRFNRDGVTSRDWRGYPILTMQEAPHVEVELIDRPTEQSLGTGEGAQAGGCRDRERICQCDRQAHPRTAADARPGEGCAWLN